MRARWIFWVTACMLCGQSQFDPTEVLAAARDKLLERSKRMPNYTCVETIERTYLKPTKVEFRAPFI
jgi:hypothetical protein